MVGDGEYSFEHETIASRASGGRSQCMESKRQQLVEPRMSGIE